MIRFDIDPAVESQTVPDEIDVRQPASGMVAATDGEMSASASASGA
jgi:hypothetical protein